jgi:hypothetical protein
MKKNINIITQFLTDLISFALFVGGIIMLISSLFTTTPVFQSVMLIVSGLVMNGISTMHGRFSEMIDLLANVLEKHNSQTENKNLTVEEIIITDKTTPEEIEMYKEKFPELKNQLDNILKNATILSKKNIEDEDDIDKIVRKVINEKDIMNHPIFIIDKMQKLEEDLKKAVENDEFELAAEIRDKINKLKM